MSVIESALNRLRGLTTDDAQIAHWIGQAAKLAACGVTERQVNLFAGFAARGRLTSEDLKMLNRDGITTPADQFRTPEPAPATVEGAAEVLFGVRDDPYNDDEWEDLTSADKERWVTYAQALQARGMLRTPVTAEQIEASAQVLLRDYQMQYDGGELHEFTDLARTALEAAGVPVEGSQP